MVSATTDAMVPAATDVDDVSPRHADMSMTDGCHRLRTQRSPGGGKVEGARDRRQQGRVNAAKVETL